jgi:copper(I)-binding protein
VSRAVASLGTALALSACNSETRVLEIERAVLTLPAGGSPAAVYMTVRNTSAIELQVVGVEVDGASGIALQSVTAHRMPTASATRGATTIMSSIAGVTIPARTSVRFAPGGYTVLVESLRTPRARGDSVRIVVRLSNAWSRSAMARVVQYADLDSALSLIPPATVATAMDTTPSEATGERLYKGNGCATCHGLAGDGTGPVGRTLVPPPRDFRVATAFRNGTTVEAIAQTLATGIPNGGAMPLYAHLTNSERRALALYIVSLRSSPLSPQATP